MLGARVQKVSYEEQNLVRNDRFERIADSLKALALGTYSNLNDWPVKVMKREDVQNVAQADRGIHLLLFDPV